MRRREFLTLAGCAAAAWPLPALGQQRPDQQHRFAVLVGFAPSDPEAQARIKTFRSRLHALGWREGENLWTDIRWASGDAALMQASAKELVATRADVLLGVTISSVTALARETRTIPIVFTQVSDPVGSGVIENLSHPGRNVTGFTNFEDSMGAKWLELLKEATPRLVHAGMLFNPKTAAGGGSFYLKPFDNAGTALRVQTQALAVHDDAEIEQAIIKLAEQSEAGLVVMPDAFTLVHRAQIIGLAQKHRLPAVYPFRFFGPLGGLICYGIDVMEQYPRAATYVDRILRGTSPSELPVQQPTKFELVINLKTAKALGLDLPPTLLARADEVIE